MEKNVQNKQHVNSQKFDLEYDSMQNPSPATQHVINHMDGEQDPFLYEVFQPGRLASYGSSLVLRGITAKLWIELTGLYQFDLPGDVAF